MTDAAGSITREGAKALGITLLNSYITVENLCLPETYIDPAGLFTAMKAGARVSTAARPQRPSVMEPRMTS